MTFTYLIKRFNMKHLKKFNEKKNYSNAFLAGKEVLQDISDILISLKDEGIEYKISPDINDDIRVKVIGLFFSGTSDVPRNFEITIRTLDKVQSYGPLLNPAVINEEQQEELESVIQRLDNYFDSINIKLKFELVYSKNIPGARDQRNLLRATNVLRTDNFDKSMLLIPKDIFCQRVLIKLKRENNI
jgi:hypothetical protein